VIRFIELEFRVDHVDMITEPGPVKVLAEQTEYEVLHSIFRRVDVSLDQHASKGIALAAHHDCAGNPVDEATQLEAKQIGSEHLLLALLREEGSTAQRVLAKAGLNLKTCRDAVLKSLSH